FARLPAVFVATAKSEYVAGHSRLECAIARRARVTFARDRATALALSQRGVNASYAGNVMMDCLVPTSVDLPANGEAIALAVLPGSRSDAGANARAAARRLALIAARANKPVRALVAQARSVETQTIIDAFADAGLTLHPTGQVTGITARGAGDRIDVYVARDATGDVLRSATIVLGQAGTGNEQAAGLGKPVIAAAQAGESPQTVGWYRMRQQKLLGDALLVVDADDDAFAREVLLLLNDPARMARMAAAGKERMGGTGAAAIIAQAAIAVARGRL
ncbi:MAG TPA: hypothetical protein VEJ20_10260, partial [Candidatus Eremiobacteraceae bacterium]|nr:hypothetical protein [Candidatus Eremiobacteraceae bacterium]